MPDLAVSLVGNSLQNNGVTLLSVCNKICGEQPYLSNLSQVARYMYVRMSYTVYENTKCTLMMTIAQLCVMSNDVSKSMTTHAPAAGDARSPRRSVCSGRPAAPAPAAWPAAAA